MYRLHLIQVHKVLSFIPDVVQDVTISPGMQHCFSSESRTFERHFALEVRFGNWLRRGEASYPPTQWHFQE